METSTVQVAPDHETLIHACCEVCKVKAVLPKTMLVSNGWTKQGRRCAVHPQLSGFTNKDWSEKTWAIMRQLKPGMQFKINDEIRKKQTMTVLEVDLDGFLPLRYSATDWRGRDDGVPHAATATNVMAYGDKIEILEGEQ